MDPLPGKEKKNEKLNEKLVKLSSVNIKCCLKNKDEELAIRFVIVKVVGDCDSSGFDHHLWKFLKTCPPS